MLNKPLIQFKNNMQSARDLETIYIALQHMTTKSIPKSEVLRAEFVALVSALDTYIHDIVRESLKYMYLNRITNNYLTTFMQNHSISNIQLLEWKIIEIHGYKTYQAPKKIKEILAKIDVPFEWIDLIGFEEKLKLIVQRRNKIAHESDINLINGLGEKWPISLIDIKHTVVTIENIVEYINHTIINKMKI